MVQSTFHFAENLNVNSSFFVQADQITLTVGQAFDLAFKKFKGNDGAGEVELRKRMMTMQQSVSTCVVEPFLRFM